MSRIESQMSFVILQYKDSSPKKGTNSRLVIIMVPHFKTSFYVILRCFGLNQ